MTDNHRATEDLLDMLHGTVAQEFLDSIRKYKNGEVCDPKTGNPIPAPAALLAQAAKFLKDNGIDRPVAPGDDLDLLKDELPEFEDDNVLQMKR